MQHELPKRVSSDESGDSEKKTEEKTKDEQTSVLKKKEWLKERPRAKLKLKPNHRSLTQIMTLWVEKTQIQKMITILLFPSV